MWKLREKRIYRPKIGIDLYSFGAPMPGRNYNNNQYRYGHNGQEKDDEIIQGLYTAEYWEYDSRIIRRWNIDPVPIAWNSPYACFNGNPVYYKDARGLTAEGGGDKGKKKNNELVVTGNNTDGYTFSEIDITSKGFWQKVGDFFKGAWNAFVEFDRSLERQKDKNDFTAPEKSKILQGGQMPTGNGSYSNNSIQASHVLSNPEVVKNDGIFSYLPGSVAGNSEPSGLVGKMGTGTKGVFKYNLTKGKDFVSGTQGAYDAGSSAGDAFNTIKDEVQGSAALTNGNESSVKQSINTSAKQSMSVPEPPVLIYYTLQTKDGFISGTEQGTQKNYKQIIKQMEAKGYTIDSIDRQLGK